MFVGRFFGRDRPQNMHCARLPRRVVGGERPYTQPDVRAGPSRRGNLETTGRRLRPGERLSTRSAGTGTERVGKVQRIATAAADHVTRAIAEQCLRMLVEEDDAALGIHREDTFLRPGHINQQGELLRRYDSLRHDTAPTIHHHRPSLGVWRIHDRMRILRQQFSTSRGAEQPSHISYAILPSIAHGTMY